MTSYLSLLNPVPGFPEYSGPHKVGTIDVELPVSQLESPSPAPDSGIPTVQYRIFYPCEPQEKTANVTWIPAPQRAYVSAYTKFLGAGPTLADFVSYFPRILHYIHIPAQKDAPLLKPNTTDKRWPVMIFSHGLGGSRNAYSHLVGSIASHGVIVIAPEHRDGSTPVSFIRDVPAIKASEKSSWNKSKRTINYVRLSHTPGPEVEAGRNAQLKVRLWELGLIHDSLVRLDEGDELTNMEHSAGPLSQFKKMMDVHTPGKITFAGHSFGAATVAQFVKSTFYSPQTSQAPSNYEPLFTPSSRSSIAEQITPKTPLILLDTWCLSLRAASTRWLWNKPLPCYTSGGLGGASILAVESEAFYKWRVHLKATKKLLSPNPASDSPYDYRRANIPEPNFFYATTSAHLSQSDFGMLFPWVAKRFLAVEEPERIMRLNVRAVMQVMRNTGLQVAETSREDMEMEVPEEKMEDVTILQPKDEIRGWKWISTDTTDLKDVGFEDEEINKEQLDNTADAAPIHGDELGRQKTGDKI